MADDFGRDGDIDPEARTGFWYRTMQGNIAHIQGDPEMSAETLAALEKLIDAAHHAIENGTIGERKEFNHIIARQLYRKAFGVVRARGASSYFTEYEEAQLEGIPDRIVQAACKSYTDSFALDRYAPGQWLARRMPDDWLPF